MYSHSFTYSVLTYLAYCLCLVPCASQLTKHISKDEEEDAVSLGDEEQPFVYEDFTDD